MTKTEIVTTTIRIPAQLRLDAQIKALREGTTFSELITMALAEVVYGDPDVDKEIMEAKNEPTVAGGQQ